MNVEYRKENKMIILDRTNDNVINSVFLNCKTSIGEVKEKLVSLINKFNQQRYTLNSKLYNRLREDIKNGCIIPPLTIAYIVPSLNEIKEMNVNYIEKYINENISNAFILDGIQRINNISKIDSIDDIKDNTIYVNVIISNSIDKLLYRMITLNNGQKPMTARHQIEILCSGMLDFDSLNLIIQTEKNQKESKKLDFSFSKENIIKAYLAFITESINIDNQRIIDEKMDELIGEKIMESSLLVRENEFSDLIKLIARMSTNEYIYNWLSNLNNMIGLSSTGDASFILNNYENEIIENKILLLEEAFKSLNQSKIKVGVYRRKIARHFIRNFEKIINIELNDLIDEISLLD